MSECERKCVYMSFFSEKIELSFKEETGKKIWANSSRFQKIFLPASLSQKLLKNLELQFLFQKHNTLSGGCRFRHLFPGKSPEMQRRH